jgi:hypothetical protein
MTPTTWRIYDPEGHYLGQANALSPAVAVARLLQLAGQPLRAADLTTTEIGENTVCVTDGLREFTVATDKRAHIFGRSPQAVFLD